ncbi:MAG TPA: class I SAM-dependent methyltransferase, partial [Tianweitania sediminis]|nr:class I SAM-dependent methyltransferase [Tianweitania sediminis]
AELLLAHVPHPKRILEIGSGDGRFMVAVARRLKRHWPNVELVLLDRQSLVSASCLSDFATLGWQAKVVQSDIFEWVSSAADERFDVITANLFLHHFGDQDLSDLFERFAEMAPVFVATEPLRTPFPLLASRMLRVIGANDVTRHDAPASVRAGFAGREVSALWPLNEHTTTIEKRRGLFTHAFAAIRQGGHS